MPGSIADIDGPALRGAAAAGEANLGQGSSQGTASAALPAGVAAAGALALAAAGRSGAARRSRAACRAAAAAAPAAPASEEPPPPPPFDPAKQLGVTAPVGFFDPLGFSKVGDEEGFRKLRIAEMKHGRVAMMASVGAVVQHYLQFP